MGVSPFSNGGEDNPVCMDNQLLFHTPITVTGTTVFIEVLGRDFRGDFSYTLCALLPRRAIQDDQRASTMLQAPLQSRVTNRARTKRAWQRQRSVLPLDPMRVRA